MPRKRHVLAAWLADERSLMSYLTQAHPGHAYTEDLLDAVALVTSWLLVALSVASIAGVLVDAALH